MMPAIPVAVSPARYVTTIADTGLPTLGGLVKLNRYMSGNPAFGGSKSGVNFLSAIAPISGEYFGRKATPRQLITRPVDWHNLGKGQGNPGHFVLLWNWCYLNVDLIAPLSFDLYDKEAKVRTVLLADVFTRGIANVSPEQKTEAQARFSMNMQTLVDMKVFGWDCIGFVQQYLIAIGFYPDYPGLLPKEYVLKGGFTAISSLEEIAPLCVICYDNHVQIIDSVQSRARDRVTVTISQSFSLPARSGPMTNESIVISSPEAGTLKYKPTKDSDTFDFDVIRFELSGTGIPKNNHAMIGKSARLNAMYPDGTVPQLAQNPLFVPGVR